MIDIQYIRTSTGAPSLMWGPICLEPNEMLSCTLRVLR